MCVNKVILLGRLAADPELAYARSGAPYAKFTVATSRRWKCPDGTKQESTHWIEVIAWGRLVENCIKFLVKGQRVYLEGRLEMTNWEDYNEDEKYRTKVVALEVQFLDRPKG